MKNTNSLSIIILSLLFSQIQIKHEVTIHDISPQLGAWPLLVDSKGIVCVKLDRDVEGSNGLSKPFQYSVFKGKGWNNKSILIESESNTHIRCFRSSKDLKYYYISVHFYKDIVLNDTLRIEKISKIHDNCLLLKTDNKLNIEWFKNVTTNIQEISDVKYDGKGNLVLSGSNYNKKKGEATPCIVKMDYDKKVILEKNFESNIEDLYSFSMVVDSENIYLSYSYLAETTDEYQSEHVFRRICMIDKSGNLIWKTDILSEFSESAQFFMTQDSQLYLLCSKQGSGNDYFKLYKLDLTGKIIFDKKKNIEYIDNLSLIDVDISGNLYFSFNAISKDSSIGSIQYDSRKASYWEVCYNADLELIESRQKSFKYCNERGLPAKFRGKKMFLKEGVYNSSNKFYDENSKKYYCKIYTADVPIFFNTKEKREKK